MSDSEVLEFGDLDLEEVDTSAADARAARIEAARLQAKQYSAKIEDPGWFNDPVEIARMKDPTRPTLFSLHQLYFQRQWQQVVDKGVELMRGGVKEEGEVIDLVLRSWRKEEGKERNSDEVEQVINLAKRWTSFRNQASICNICAETLFSLSAVSPLPTSTSSDSLVKEALSASLAALRLNRLQAPFLATLGRILRSIDPFLATTLETRSTSTELEREEIARRIEGLELSEGERETLETVLGLKGEEKEVEEEVGRDVRSL